MILLLVHNRKGRKKPVVEGTATDNNQEGGTAPLTYGNRSHSAHGFRARVIDRAQTSRFLQSSRLTFKFDIITIIIMDPLSITASVVGLLAAAGKMTTIIRSAISAWREPPIVLLEADMEVGDFGRVLSTLRRYLVQVDEITPERRPLIALDDLIATFTDAVLTFSGLERVITEYQNTSVSIQPFVWAKCRESTAWHVRALQRQKSSLSLMLSIIQWQVIRESPRGWSNANHSTVSRVSRQ